MKENNQTVGTALKGTLFLFLIWNAAAAFSRASEAEGDFGMAGPPPPPRAARPAAAENPPPAAARAVAPRSATTLWDAGDPTADEQYVLEVVNRARANPPAEGARLGIDITSGLTPAEVTLVGPRPPLAMNKILLGTARAHSQDMYANNYFDHYSNNGTVSPADRMSAAGYNYTVAGENIAAGTPYAAADLEDLLMIDSGVNPPGHRINLLDIDSGPYFREAGVGYYAGATPNAISFQDYLTQDFGAQSTGPFLLGVVYVDVDGDNFYEQGEGIPGVTVTPDSGTYYAATSSSGGYAFPVGTSGTLNVTISGGPFTSPITQPVTLTGTNAKLDFIISASSMTAAPTFSPPAGTYSTAQSVTLSTLTSGAAIYYTTDGNTPTASSAQYSSAINVSAATTLKAVAIKTGLADSAVASATYAIGGGGGGGGTQLLALAKIGVKLFFTGGGKDSISLSGKLPVTAGLVLAGQSVAIQVGGVSESFSLDNKGNGLPAGTNNHFKLRVKSAKGVIATQNAPFTAKFIKGDFTGALAAYGLVGTTTVHNNPLTLPVTVLFNAQTLQVQQPVLYSATASKTGTAK